MCGKDHLSDVDKRFFNAYRGRNGADISYNDGGKEKFKHQKGF
jgi:hypothetical protein